MKNISRLFVGFATGGYIGFIPFAPGTFGSLLGIPLFYFMSSLPLPAAFSLMIVFTLFSIWVAGKAEKSLKAKDPGCIVIDEIAGMGVTFLAIPFNIYLAVCGFIVFRFFDILKPFPVNYLEKRFTGGTGVVLDDVAAGVMSNIVLQIILLVMK
jgi:phosphatidylglycerophosphatase A